MKGQNGVMNTKTFRLLATSLLLALVLVSIFFVSASSQAHAAQLKPAVGRTSGLPMGEKQIDSARTAMNNCKPAGTVYTSWWKIRLHLYPCGVQLVEAGVGIGTLFPGTTIPAGLSVAAISVQAAQSCDGSVNIDYSWLNSFIVVPSVSPGC
jgi:hypothetical protein